MADVSLQVGQVVNEVNDGDSIGQSLSSSVHAATDSTVENNCVISDNYRVRDDLKNIARCNRCQHAKGKNAMWRHTKMSAEDLNNVHAIREYVRRKVFSPHYKLKDLGWNKWSVDPKSISRRCCKITISRIWVSDEDWWIDDGTPVYINAKSNPSSNFEEGMRKQSECEY